MNLTRAMMTVLLAIQVLCFRASQAADKAAPPPYVPATAHYILPETTSDQSGYFSLSESLDGTIHVGTAKYNINAFLVEFDPRTSKQKIVIDVNKTCGLSATGYAAQSKIHTRNFVGPSGKVYVGSKQGYRLKGDTSEYPGGYVITYDPRTGRAENLGMPLAGQGIIDVVADESRARMYAVTCEDQHWMVGSIAAEPAAPAPWSELGPLLTPYATTLVDSRGIASVITKDFALAQCDPATDKATTRPILVDGKVWTRANASAIPTWQLDPDGRHAWLILMNDPALIRIDLHSAGEHVSAENAGLMLEGKNPDSRCALTIHPDGKIYAIVRIQNTTGFGTGMLHHLVRYDPAARKHEDLGVLKVQNPDFFDWSPGPDGKQKPWTHGYHRLPDGTLTPLHAHMALIAARDGTLYATILYPFTLLKIDTYKVPVAKQSAAASYLDALNQKLDDAAVRLPEISQLAQRLAERHLRGGMIGFPWIGCTLEQELIGRSGGLMHCSFDRGWKKDRTDDEKAADMMFFSWDDAPKPGDLKRLRDEKAKGRFVVGFGAKNAPLLAEHVAACDAWLDNGAGADDRVVDPGDGKRVGKTNHFVNNLNAWVLMGEFVSALTRAGKMPVMNKSWLSPGGHEWGEKYATLGQFHSDFNVAPIPAGELGRSYIDRIRYMVQRLNYSELPRLRAIAERVDAELRAGRKTIVASSGHMVMCYVGRYDDKLWADNFEIHEGVASQIKAYEKTPAGALVLRLGTTGLGRELQDIFKGKQQRVILVASESPVKDFAIPASVELKADLGMAFGDACVPIANYPINILPPSGIIQVAAYEAIDAEVHQRHSAP